MSTYEEKTARAYYTYEEKTALYEQQGLTQCRRIALKPECYVVKDNAHSQVIHQDTKPESFKVIYLDFRCQVAWVIQKNDPDQMVPFSSIVYSLCGLQDMVDAAQAKADAKGAEGQPQDKPRKGQRASA